MTARARRPLAILAASLAAGGAALLLGPGPLRALLGAALVLVLPGAALTALLGGGLGAAERVLATLAASIAVAVLAGLAIGDFGSGFDAPAWVAMLTGVAVAGSLAALVVSLRRRPPRAAPRMRPPRLAPATLACGLAAAAIAVLAVVIAHRSGERNAARAAEIVNLVSPAAARADARAQEAALAGPVRRARVAPRRGGTR